MSRKHRWKLQVYWNGGWRTLWSSEEYRELTEYVKHCPEEMQFRIIDTLAERKSDRK